MKVDIRDIDLVIVTKEHLLEIGDPVRERIQFVYMNAALSGFLRGDLEDADMEAAWKQVVDYCRTRVQ